MTWTSSETASSRRRTTSSAFPGREEELELTFNHDGRRYELGTAYGHIALVVDDLDREASSRVGQRRPKAVADQLCCIDALLTSACADAQRTVYRGRA
jgi:hypothetical protein